VQYSWLRKCFYKIHCWIPPEANELLKPYLRRGIYFKGQFQNWSQARAHSSGYDSDLILEKVKEAQLKVKAGEATFERDSVLFDCIHYSFPVLAALQHVAIRHAGRLSVLDFGGALGSSYFQCQPFLSVLENLQWSVVEQANFVHCGKRLFTDDKINFFDTIADCVATRRPNAALLSSVLQYVPEPYAVLDQLMQNELPVIVVDRTPFSDLDDDFITVQHVPKKIYPATYPCWVFSRNRFKAYIDARYNIMTEFESADGRGRADGTPFTFSGMILCKHD
jgi:putative methyltransferase (TIGR04325 family)